VTHRSAPGAEPPGLDADSRQNEAAAAAEAAAEAQATASGEGDEPSEIGATTMGRRHVRGSALLVVGRVVSMFISMATQVLIVRALTKSDYGTFAYALAISSAGSTILSLGQGKLLSRFMAMYEEQKDYARMFGAMTLAIGTVAVTSVIGIVGVFAFQGALLGGTFQSAEQVKLVLILIFMSPLEALDQVFVSLFAVFSKPKAIFFRKFLLAPGLRLVVILLLIGTGSSVTFLAYGYVISTLFGVSLYVGLLIKLLADRGLLHAVRPRDIVLPYKAVFAFSFPLITGEIALLSLNVGGVLILGAFHSVVQVANYRAVFNSARLNTAVSGSFVTLFLPVIARLHARNDIDGLRRNYWHTALFVAVLTFPIFALTGPLAPTTTVVLFGERYSASSTVLALLAIGYYVNVCLGFNTYTVQLFGRIRYLVVVNVVVIAMNVALGFLLAPPYAASGIAAANCVALVTQNLLNQWALRGCIATSWIDREYVRPYLMIAALAGVLWLFQLLVDPGFLLAGIAAAIAWAALLIGTRHWLELADTFPELRRVPLLGRLVR
jgi:O-antigen/teichoic acid export membrane protein